MFYLSIFLVYLLCICCVRIFCWFAFFFFFFFFKQKTAYEMRISDWSSDVCSSDLSGSSSSPASKRRAPRRGGGGASIGNRQPSPASRADQCCSIATPSSRQRGAAHSQDSPRGPSSHL